MCWGPLGQLTTDLEPSGQCVSHDRLMPTSPVPLTPQRFFRLLYLRHLWATDLMGLVLPRTPECPSREVHRPSLKDVRPLLPARPPRYRSSRVPIKLFQSSPRGSHSALFTSAANHPVASVPLPVLGLPSPCREATQLCRNCVHWRTERPGLRQRRTQERRKRRRTSLADFRPRPWGGRTQRRPRKPGADLLRCTRALAWAVSLAGCNNRGAPPPPPERLPRELHLSLLEKDLKSCSCPPAEA